MRSRVATCNWVVGWYRAAGLGFWCLMGVGSSGFVRYCIIGLNYLFWYSGEVWIAGGEIQKNFLPNDDVGSVVNASSRLP